MDCKEIQPVHSEGDQPWVFTGRTDAEAETPIYFGHLMRRVDSLEKTLILAGIGDRRKRGRQRMRWLDSITDAMDRSLSEGDQSSVFFGRNDAKAETPVLWPPHAKSWEGLGAGGEGDDRG